MGFSKAYQRAHNMGRMLVNKTNYKSGLCSFGVITDSVRDDISIRSAACHAYLNRIDPYGTPLYVVDALYPYNGNPAKVKTGRLSNRMAKEYVRYVLTQSPYASIFAENSIDLGWRRRYYIYRTDVDSNLLVGGLVAIRMLSEKPHIPYLWALYTRAGMDSNLAFLLAYSTGHKGDDLYVKNYTGEGHTPIAASHFNNENVNSFLNGEHSNYGTYAHRKTYRGFNGMWGENKDNFRKRNDFNSTILSKWKDKLLLLAKPVEMRVALFNHDFNNKDNAREETLPIKEAIPALCEIINEYKGELNAEA